MVIRNDIDERKNDFRAKQLYGELYDDVEFVNGRTPVQINCTLKYHGSFFQPEVHRGSGGPVSLKKHNKSLVINLITL